MTVPVQIFKFGGASVKDAEAVRNIAEIIRKYPAQPLVVVVSAMGKMTNALEELVHAYVNRDSSVHDTFHHILAFHQDILKILFPQPSHPVYSDCKVVENQLSDILKQTPGSNFDFEYDQIVSCGEWFSSLILSHSLTEAGITNTWFDARKLISTDATYRAARVHWDRTTKQIKESMTPFLESPLFTQVAVTQGFIGATQESVSTTLGREGSDYSAAIFAYALNAASVTIWKDVPGLFNADPKHFENTIRIDRISFKESLELSYYGVGVIHPNTIKPLQNKGIPLYVKSFNDPDDPGTLVSDVDNAVPDIPCYIHKDNQWLLSIESRDFSYINEASLHTIFGVFSALGIHINLMQNAAISFSVCMDDPGHHRDALMNALQKDFIIRYNTGLRLLTIRNYTDAISSTLAEGHELLLEQKSRHTCQMVLRKS